MRPFLAMLICLLVAACDGPDAITRRRAELDAADPPQLWSITVVDAKGRTLSAPVRICADTPMRVGFLNQTAGVGDNLCKPDLPPVIRADIISTRCQMNGRSFAVYNAAVGDRARDFTVAFTLQSLDEDTVRLAQTRRYRYLGACPAGWGVGESRP